MFELWTQNTKKKNARRSPKRKKHSMGCEREKNKKLNILEEKKEDFWCFRRVMLTVAANNRQFAMLLTNLGELVSAINSHMKGDKGKGGERRDHKQQLILSMVSGQQRLRNFAFFQPSAEAFFCLRFARKKHSNETKDSMERKD